jgi:MFS family permease
MTAIQKPLSLVVLLNLGHTFDHLFMLIFPTVVLVMAPAFGLSYAGMLPLSLGGFIAFGAGSLPAGWLGDRWSRHGMMVVFFVGIGFASILTAFARSPAEIAAGLTLIGLFAAIYHPVGIAVLVKDEPRVGLALGINGVAGNLGLAFAALVSGALADLLSWRAAFIVPGVLSILCGAAFSLAVPKALVDGGSRRRPGAAAAAPGDVVRVFAVLVAATVAGGIIFNATTIAMPKIFAERLTELAHSAFGVGAFVCAVYVLAAVAQLCVGQLIDRRPLRGVFIFIAVMQPPLLLLAGSAADWGMLAVATAMMFFVFGQIPINDAMVARYIDDRWRARAYALRYVISFGASATSVPLVAFLYGRTGGFTSVFLVLAGLALVVVTAALCFPRARAVPVAAPAE